MRILWYRPPDSNIWVFDRFEKFLKEIDDENKELILTGGFQLDLLKI